MEANRLVGRGLMADSCSSSSSTYCVLQLQYNEIAHMGSYRGKSL